MQLEATVKQNGKVIIHTFLEATTLQKGLEQIESYVKGENLAYYSECLVNVKMCAHHAKTDVKVDVSDFDKFTYDALKKS